MDDFEKVVGASSVVTDLGGGDAESIVTALVDALVADGGLPASRRDEAIGVVLARERLGSTAIADGVALPHGYLDGLAGAAMAVGVHRDGIGFGAADGQPVHLFVLLLNSTQAVAGHIKFLAQLSRRLLQPSVLAAVRAARTSAGVRLALCPA